MLWSGANRKQGVRIADAFNAPDLPSPLEAAFATAVEGIAVIDDHGRILMCNPACERLFGYTASEAVGQNVSLLMPEPDRGRHDGYLASYRAGGRPQIIGIGREVLGRRRDGSTFPMDLSVGEARQNGERLFVGVIRDISGRKETERRLRVAEAELAHAARLTALGQMTSALAHELNQPLTAISNYAQACRRLLEASEPPTELLRDTMGKMANQAIRAGQIVRRLRQFASKGEVERSIEAPRPVIEEACQLALTGAREAGIQVTLEFAGDLPDLAIDRIQIQQVIVNLVRNAVEALHGASRRELEVRARPTAEGGIEVVVADSGPGFAKEISERPFQPFVSTKARGMGLGLSICRTIVEAHGGTMSIAARPEGGSAVGFRLPAGDAG